jgi:chromosomal replication initiation ATPase DnaA
MVAPPPLPDVATIWDGRSLGQCIARALATDHLDRLTAVFLARPIAVIDDIDRFGRREIQSAFVHLFDMATTRGIALCLSVARHPAALDALEPNVVSRLVGGLVVRPRSATPAAHGGGCRSASVSLARVLRTVARHHHLDVATLVGPSRRRAIAEARSLAMYVARAVTGRSLRAIGAACGGRDHTTALHATRTQAARIAADPALAADVERMIDQFVDRLSKTRESQGRR